MANYNLNGVTWDHLTLTYSFATVNYDSSTQPAQFSNILSNDFLRNEIREAFASWDAVSFINFVEVADGPNVDIRIGYANIDGPYNTLAQTTYFSSNGFFKSDVVIRFDFGESYSISGQDAVLGNGVTFYSVALHEIGHALGLGHYEAGPAIMHASASAAMKTLQNSDIDGIHALYGTPQDPISLAINNFGQASGWSTFDRYPRDVVDVNGDGRADIVGFGQGGVWVSLANTNGTFAPAKFALSNFGQDQGWSSYDRFERSMADVNGDGRADIVGFGQAGTWVALAGANGTFADAKFTLGNFGQDQGWNSANRYFRDVADVNGDGRADVVGFGQAGTYVSLATGNGAFATATLSLTNFGAAQGWSNQDQFPRFVADVNGDGRADIVGFGQSGVWVALAKSGGGFNAATMVMNGFGQDQGWNSNDHYLRTISDVNGDGRADIIAFGEKDVYVALANGSGGFNAPAIEFHNFTPGMGGWTSNNAFPRFVADINGDHRADLIGFGQAGAYDSLVFA